MAIALLLPLGGCHLLALSPAPCTDDNNCPFEQRCQEGFCVVGAARDGGAERPDAGRDAGDVVAVDAGDIDAGQDAGADAGIDAGVVDAGPDANPDAGTDGGPFDAGTDGGPIDAGADGGPLDAGAVDGGADAGVADAGPLDAGVDAGVDGGPFDAGAVDGGVDAGPIDAGPPQACLDAVPITVGPAVFGSTAGLPNTITTDCNNGPRGEVAYRFVNAGAERPILVSVQSGPQADHIIEVRHACEDSDSVVVCEDVAGVGQIDRVAFTAEAGAEYAIIIDTFQGDEGPFEVTLEMLPPLSSVCLSVPSLENISGVETGTLTGAHNYLDAQDYGLCTGYPSVGGDRMYSVQLGVGERFDATLIHDGDEVLYMLDACDAPAAAMCVVGADLDGSAAEVISYTATESGTYFVVVDAFRHFSGSFELTWSITPAP